MSDVLFVRPRPRPSEEPEERQFKLVNQGWYRTYLYMQHDHNKIPILVGDMVFVFKSPRDRHTNHGCLITRSLPSLNTLLRDPNVIDVVTPTNIWAAFKYLGVCAFERPHWRREEKLIRQMRLIIGGTLRVLDVFADLPTLTDPDSKPGPTQTLCSGRYCFLWLRPCGFNSKGDIVMRDPQTNNNSIDDLKAGMSYSDWQSALGLDENKRTENTDVAAAADDDDGLDAYYYRDPFELGHLRDQSMDANEERLRKAREAAEKLRTEALKTNAKRTFWQYIPIATDTMNLASIEMPRVNHEGEAVDEHIPNAVIKPFTLYPDTIYVGRVMDMHYGSMVLMPGKVWRHCVFGPPVIVGSDTLDQNRQAVYDYRENMTRWRPQSRVIHVDATDCQ